MNMGDVVESLFRVGKPLIIASDVQEMPYSVEKIQEGLFCGSIHPKTGREC